jgi:hypothetical protein
MGVAAAAIDRVEALPVGEVHRHVGLADDDRARCLQPPHQLGIVRGDGVLEARMAEGGGKPFDVEAFLDRHRHAEQRLIGSGTRLVHRLCGFVGPFEIGHGERVDIRIELLYPHDRSVDCLGHAAPPVTDFSSRGESAGFVGQLRIGHA